MIIVGDPRAHRQMVLGVATAVAEAKKGVSPTEEAVIDAVKDALGADQAIRGRLRRVWQ